MLNNENLKGYNLPLGATNILTSGKEYEGIFPVWNWNKIPGTTAVQHQDSTRLEGYLFGNSNYIFFYKLLWAVVLIPRK